MKKSHIKTINKSKGFYDINNHWAQDVIKEFVGKGHASGYEDGTFRPNNNITRAEFITMVNNVFGFNSPKEKEFKDVKKTDWFYEELKIAIGAGYISGYEDNTFRPNSPITREEVASIVTNITKTQDRNLDKLSTYKDAHHVSQWAKPAVEGALESEFMSGYEGNVFKPKNKITRAEAVVTLSRINLK